MTSRYGNQRVKRGLIHFFVGKGVSAVAGLAAMLLVVRGLSIADFARYSVLIALVELFTAISGLGLVQLVLRYVPEFYATYQTKALRELIGGSFGVRTAVLIACSAIAWANSEVVSSWIGLAGATLALEAFILVVIFRSSANFLSQTLESTLHQGISQFAFSFGAVLRCIGMAWLVNSNAVSLLHVILVEALCDGCSLTILFFGVILVLKERAIEEDKSEEISDISLRKMASFALMAYFQHLAILPYGGNMNRLVGGNLFGELMMASFGFAQSLYEYAKRYFPTQFLIGMIRPVVVARYTATRDFPAAVALCEQAFQFNLSLLAGALSLLIVDGDSLLSFFSGGKYTTQSATLLICLLILFAFETHRLIIEVLTQVVEHYELMIPGNVLLSASVLGGIFGYQWIGAISFPLANMASLICANGFVVRRLKTSGFKYSHDWPGSVKSLGIFIASVLVGKISIILGAYWFVALALTLTVFITLFLQTKMHESRCFFTNLLG